MFLPKTERGLKSPGEGYAQKYLNLHTSPSGVAYLYFAPDLNDPFFIIRYYGQVNYLERHLGLRDSIKKIAPLVK